MAAGEETLGHALLEAFCQLEDSEEPVLMVYADMALPGEYRGFAERPEPGRAIGVLLAHAAARTTTLEATAAGGAPSSPRAQADAFFNHLADARPGSWTGPQRSWTWH